jgi:outer membrane protein assembly factor BamB
MIESVDHAGCPNCGAELPLGRSGGTVTCAFCSLTSSYSVVSRAIGGPSRLDALEQIAVVPLPGSAALVVGWHDATLEACDPRSGASVWRVQLGQTRQPITCAFERIYLATDAGELVAVDSATGYVAFAATLPATVRTVADLCGPTQARARLIVHCSNGELVALDRMTGQIVEHWPSVASPWCWATGSGRLLVGPVGAELWLIDPMRRDPIARLLVAALGGCIVGGLAFAACRDADHVAIDLGDGHVVWHAAAPWNPTTGACAAFGSELFVADGQRISAVPTGGIAMVPAPIDELCMIAGMLIVRAGPNLLGYQRSLQPAWSVALGALERLRIADNDRMLVVAIERAGQLWLRGLLPSGRPRWNTLVPDAGTFVEHSVVGDLVLADTGNHRVVLAADSGQLMWTSRQGATIDR